MPREHGATGVKFTSTLLLQTSTDHVLGKVFLQNSPQDLSNSEKFFSIFPDTRQRSQKKFSLIRDRILPEKFSRKPFPGHGRLKFAILDNDELAKLTPMTTTGQWFHGLLVTGDW